MLSFVAKELALVLNLVNKEWQTSNTASKDVLSIEYIEMETTIIEMAESLI